MGSASPSAPCPCRPPQLLLSFCCLSLSLAFSSLSSLSPRCLSFAGSLALSLSLSLSRRSTRTSTAAPSKTGPPMLIRLIFHLISRDSTAVSGPPKREVPQSAPKAPAGTEPTCAEPLRRSARVAPYRDPMPSRGLLLLCFCDPKK